MYISFYIDRSIISCELNSYLIHHHNLTIVSSLLDSQIVHFVDNGRIDYRCNFADDQKRTCPTEPFTLQDDGSAVMMGPFDCGTDGDTQLGCCTITAPKEVVDAYQNARTRRRRGEVLGEVMTFDLPDHGRCTVATGPGDDVSDI